MEIHWLTCHPDTPGKAIKAISAKLSHPAQGHVGVWFNLFGVIGDLILPARQGHHRADELWKSTCLEVFIGATEGPGYSEFNFSPGGGWAAYTFSDYRTDMSQAFPAREPEIYDETRRVDECHFGLRILHSAPPGVPVGLTAVIAEHDGTISYWALAHPQGKPDFHHRSCFAATLPAPHGS